jgi:DNA-binding NarL/FixJ family response regulator
LNGDGFRARRVTARDRPFVGGCTTEGACGLAKTSVLLADDHRLIVEAVRAALEEDDAFEVVAVVNDATKILPLVAELRPDVVVLDVAMPRLDGITCLKRIRSAFPDVVVVMLSALEDPAVAKEALELGARAFVLKHIDPAELGDVIRQAIDGSVYQSAGVFAEAFKAIGAEVGLTAKELQILNLLSTGLTNSEIAKELWIAEQTVKFHLSNIYRKLGAKGRTAAVQAAERRGLITNPLLRES